MDALQSSQEIKSKPKNKLIFFAMLLALLAMIISLVLYNELRSHLRLLQENQIRMGNAEIEYGQAVTLLRTQVQAQENKLLSFNDTLEHVSQMVGPVENGLLIQAEYLVQLAQLNLKYQGDIAGALALLKMADQRLSTLSLSPILEVRHVLAKNSSELEAISSVDLAGVITQLNALSDQVDQLPLVPSLPRTSPTIKQPKNPTKLDTYLTDWKDALSTSWHALERVVIIRHHGQPLEPLLEPEEYRYLKQNIHLQLDQAQWAALHQQQAIYIASLQRATSWVNHYFTDNGLISRAVQRSLVDLQKIVIQPKVPDLSATLSAIQQAQKRIFTMNKSAVENAKTGASA